ncbi:MAG: XRE family transcriptional regulator [Thermodesulfobacteriota bacterium]
MAKKFSRLREQMSSESREKAQAKAQEMLAELPLHEVRQARGMTQKVLADVLQVKQPAVAKLEKRTDMYISTLRSHIQAMGGELDIIARFPDGSNVKIDNFSELENDVQKDDKSRRANTSTAT